MDDIRILLELWYEIEQEEDSYIKSLRIADIIERIEISLGA